MAYSKGLPRVIDGRYFSPYGLCIERLPQRVRQFSHKLLKPMLWLFVMLAVIVSPERQVEQASARCDRANLSTSP